MEKITIKANKKQIQWGQGEWSELTRVHKNTFLVRKIFQKKKVGNQDFCKIVQKNKKSSHKSKCFLKKSDHNKILTFNKKNC